MYEIPCVCYTSQYVLVERISSDTTVRFELGPSLYGHDVALFINCPSSPEIAFKRDCYRPLKWKYHFADYADGSNAYSDCHFAMSGSFRFYFTIDDNR